MAVRSDGLFIALRSGSNTPPLARLRAIVEAKAACLRRGRHKARVFLSAPGLTALDAEFLRSELLQAARESDAIVVEREAYGERCIVDFELVRGGRRATVRSAWIIRSTESAPRLTSCYVL